MQFELIYVMCLGKLDTGGIWTTHTTSYFGVLPLAHNTCFPELLHLFQVEIIIGVEKVNYIWVDNKQEGKKIMAFRVERLIIHIFSTWNNKW